MGISNLVANLQLQLSWSAQNNLVGAVYNPTGNTGVIRKSYDFGTKAANNVSGGGDQFFSFQQAIAGGGSATIDLTAMSNILQQANMSIVRIKGYLLRLLSVGDDPTITTPVASGITVSNFLPTLPNGFGFGSGGSGLTVNITVSAGVIATVAVANAGSGYPKSSFFPFAVTQAGGSGGVLIAGTDGTGVVTSVGLAAAGSGGAGYTTTTGLATVELGKFVILTGGCRLLLDTTALGPILVPSTAKNLQILNNDAANTATVELSVLGASS